MARVNYVVYIGVIGAVYPVPSATSVVDGFRRLVGDSIALWPLCAF